MLARNLARMCLAVCLGLAIGQQPALAAKDGCLACHSAPGFRTARGGEGGTSLRVEPAELAQSAHSGKDCVDCHIDFRGQKIPHKPDAEPVSCVRCHRNGGHAGAPDTTRIERYADSVHGTAFRNGDTDAPKCATCHGTHDIRPASDPKSNVYRASIPDTCGTCHFDGGVSENHKMASVDQYRDSVHAKLIARGNTLQTAAVCTDCHGVHDIKAPGQPGSSANRLRVPETCGRCHREALEEFRQSIHGKAVAEGLASAPVCTDCHREHLVSKPSSSDSPASPAHIAATCSKCHEDVGIQRKFGLPANRLSSYIGSYHGVANKYGDLTVANCATCHGAHNVLPSSDPGSAVNKKNLPATCGKCHPGASKHFAEGSIHVVPTPKQDVVVFWVRLFYILFVAAMIGSFVGYIILDLIARMTGRLPWKRGDHGA